eukprot:155031_1
MAFYFSVFVIGMTISVLIYFILLENEDITSAEKFTPYATNMLRYHWSLYPFDYGTNDSLSAMFIPPITRYIIASPILRWIVLLFMQSHKQFSMFPILAYRTEFFDQTWIKGIQEDNIKQIVLLGAGFDDRSIRFEHIIKQNNVTIFEADLPNLILRKRKLISKYLGSDELPSYLSLVGCDLNIHTLDKCLSEYNFNPNVRTIFHMEGLIMYLEPHMVHKIFNFVKQKLEKGSIISFDMLIEYDGIDDLKKELEKRNELLKFVLKDSEVDMFIKKYDLTVVIKEGVLEGLTKHLPKDIHDRFGLPEANHGYHILSKLE